MESVTLSVIIPAYNEATTIETVLTAVRNSGVADQMIVVDDGSTDQTGLIARRWRDETNSSLIVVAYECNLGKGAAIRAALPHVTGSHVVIQDADLECDPADLGSLVAALVPRVAPVVFGSRTREGASWQRGGLTWNRLGVQGLNVLVWLLFGRKLTDEAACYKLMPTPLLRTLDLQCRRFEFCPEVIAKLCRLGWPIVEVPVHYHPRTRAEGKKLRPSDGVVAVWTLLRWRFAPLSALALHSGTYSRQPEARLGESTLP